MGEVSNAVIESIEHDMTFVHKVASGLRAILAVLEDLEQDIRSVGS